MSIEDVEITNEILQKQWLVGQSQQRPEKTRLEQVAVTAAEGKSRAMNILLQRRNRIKTLDEAMSKISKVTQQRELIRSARDVVGRTKSTFRRKW